MAWAAGQRYAAEFLGTMALLLGVGGAAVFITAENTADLAAVVVLISLSVGIVVLAMIYVFGEVSGGHFNPAVTVSMALSGKMRWKDVGPYLAAQVLGGMLGISIVLGIAYGNAATYATAQRIALSSQCYAITGGPAYCAYGIGAVLLVEVALTFFFVLVIHFVTRPESPAKNLAPFAIGLALMATNLVAIPVDGASINPARSFAPALVSLIVWPSVTWAITASWLFWVAPIFGGVLASIVERLFRRPMG